MTTNSSAVLSSAQANQDTIRQRIARVRAELRAVYYGTVGKLSLTADDARKVALQLGYEIGNWIGSVWHEGFYCTGYTKSSEPSRKGGLIRQWRPVA